jgi:hypothetical protein
MYDDFMDSAPCACGCGELARPGNKFVHGHNARKSAPRVPQPCACGCGELASIRGEYRKNHDKRRPPRFDPRPCACGCGELASGDTSRDRPGQYVSGHNSRVRHPMQDKRHSAETRELIAQKAREQAAAQFPEIANHNPHKTHPAAHGSWHWMMSRCFDSWNASYPYYGGRGITVCEKWLTFDGFFADMGDRPDGKTLDRLDPDANYEPGNCRWATRAEQNAHRRNPWDTRRAKYGPSGRTDG